MTDSEFIKQVKAMDSVDEFHKAVDEGLFNDQIEYIAAVQSQWIEYEKQLSELLENMGTFLSQNRLQARLLELGMVFASSRAGSVDMMSVCGCDRAVKRSMEELESHRAAQSHRID